MVRAIFLALLVSAALTGCATYEPVPKDYVGPKASVRDTGFSEDHTKAQLFALVEIDGHIIRNAFGASASESYGRGATLTTVYPEREVPVRPMKVTLVGSHATGAPIHALASQLAGTFFSVEGVVDFTPEPDHQYVVKGELSKEKSSVWIEDIQSAKPVTTIVSK